MMTSSVISCSFLVTRKKNLKNWSKKLIIFWATWDISKKFSWKMWIMIILKVTKKQRFILSLSEECFFWKNHREEGQIEAHQPFYGLFRNAIILIFISCESLILGESKHVYYRKDSQYFLYIGVKTPAIGNLDNFSVFMNDEGNILKICTCSLLFSKDIWEVFLQGLKLFKIKEPQIFHLRHFIIKYYN